MDQYGYYRVRAYVPEVRIANPQFNARQLITAIEEAYSDGVDCLVTPELSLSGYTCGDLFQQDLLMKQTESELRHILEKTVDTDILVAIGAPVSAFGKRFNCAVVICSGQILGIVPKSYIPTYGEFYEKRWFESGRLIKGATIDFADSNNPFGTDLIFKHKDAKIGVEICEDLWVPNPPSGSLAMAGAQIILNLSASDELIGKQDYLVALISQQSARCRAAYVYASAGWGESSTDLVFNGKAIIAEGGVAYGENNRFFTHSFSETRDIDIQKINIDREKFNTFAEKESFSEAFRHIIAPQSNPSEEKNKDLAYVDPLPFIPSNPLKLNQRCEEIVNIQSYGLMKRLDAIKCRKAIIGISGGLDSTLALLVTVKAFDKLNLPRKGIIAITMPGLATSQRTKSNATALMEKLGVTSLEIPIREAVDLHFKDIGQQPDNYDATYENSQARERTQILMDMANKEGGIVIGTGDMSELALGWCTYNGDHMSMYGVNASVPKTLVRHLVRWFADNSEKDVADILIDICDTPISPELVPSSSEEIGQITEDLVGPYELHDFFLFHFLRNSFEPKKIFALAIKAFENKYDRTVILKWLKVFFKRFFSQQFKRSCMPDGPKVGSVNLSPRGDWRMPSDASPELWLSQIQQLENAD